MTLTELATMHDLQLEIIFSTQTEMWYATISNADIKRDGFLVSCGASHCHDYEMCLPTLADYLSGKTIIVNALEPEKRKEIKVPKSITE